jgi:hypothetical protein
MPGGRDSRRQRPTDLRADLHSHVTAFVADDDRRWFEEHPDETVRHRPAVPHEWHDPDAAPNCVPLFHPPEFLEAVEPTLMVEVTLVAPGARRRSPYYVLAPGTAA